MKKGTIIIPNALKHDGGKDRKVTNGLKGYIIELKLRNKQPFVPLFRVVLSSTIGQ